MKLPRISGIEAVKAFGRYGYHIERQRGSHIIMAKGGTSSLSIPNHKELDKGTLCSLIRQASLSIEKFLELLR